jgi:CheY-like chemotaxis protein
VQAEAQPDVFAQSAELADFTVLLAEDDTDTREAVAMLLETFGIRVLEAADGDEAFARFQEARPDVVLSDIWMTPADGFSLVSRIRALSFEQGGLTPAIAMTAAGMPPEDTLMRGFQVHLRKPVEAIELIDALRAFARARSAEGAANASWIVNRPDGGAVVITLTGHVSAGDMRAAAKAVARQLGEKPGRVVADLRRLRSFDLAAPSVAQETVWPVRRRMEHVVVLGGSLMARLVSRAACAVLRVPCDVVRDEPFTVSAAR